METKLLQSLVQQYNEIAEGYNLDKDNRVEHDAASAEFAKHYVAGHKGDHSLRLRLRNMKRTPNTFIQHIA